MRIRSFSPGADRSLAMSSSDNLNAEPFRILNVKPGVKVLFRIYSTLLQFSGDRIPVEVFNRDREMIHDTRRALMVERHEGFPHAETHDFVWFVLAHHRQPEYL